MTSLTNINIEESLEKIRDLYIKYKEHPYMSQRLNYHLTNVLPSSLENELKNHEKRVERMHFLTKEQEIFIQVFLNNNKYYYLPNNNCFYSYNGKTYSVVKEDDIQHQLLSTISKDKTLMEWKHKTKINIIKQIKERNLLTKSIPETDTFQNILNFLYPTLFSNKNQVKYFLTIIGDNILKKSSDLIFLLKPKTKKILMEIENIAYMTIGLPNITNNLVTKFHENYQFENCRLLKMNDTISIDIWKDFLRKYGLDLLCVSAHYSNRYESSENFLNNNVNEDLKTYSLYLKNNNQNLVIDEFCKHSIISSPVSYNNNNTEKNKFSIQWKNMHYIWKLYISQFSLPSMIYANTLKNLLKERFSYDEETDSFLNITSKYLPNVSDFILFWKKNIRVSTINDFETDLEIDEMCALFKKWVQQNSNICSSNGNISETDVFKILNHFFPSIQIVENKYIYNVVCPLWNKSTDIESSLIQCKTFYKNVFYHEQTPQLIPFDEIYNYYVQFCNKNKPNSFLIVSKRYFEKYLCTFLSNYIEFDKFISNKWYME